MAKKKQSQFYVGMFKVGRPAIFATPELLLASATEYFIRCDEEQSGKITRAGLRRHLGFTRQNWADYRKRDDEFSYALDQIESVFEEYYELKLAWPGGFPGGKYYLTCFGGEEWREVQHSKVEADVNAEVKEVWDVTLNLKGQ